MGGPSWPRRCPLRPVQMPRFSRPIRSRTTTVEPGFRWIKNPAAIAPVWLEKPERIAALAMLTVLGLLVYSVIQRQVRQRCLHEELGRTIVIPRTQRQLIGKVIALLIDQADLLDEEEERLLPVLRQHLGEAEQLAMARRLLFDPESEDEQWMLDWVAPHLTEAERHAMADLVARFEPDASSLLEASGDDSGVPDAAQTAATDEDLVLLAAKTADGSPIDVMYLLHKALNIEA